MSGTRRLGGSVLGEQTQLAFTSHPPASGCSPVLPSAVCEGRGGEKGFAMNQKTQLQFNLGIAPDHGKLATNFTPSHPPSPVTIHRAAADTIGMSCTPVQNFKAVSPERLALAVKLAKRNARNAQDMRVQGNGDSEGTDESVEEVDLEPKKENDQEHESSETVSRELEKLRLELIKRLGKSKGVEKKHPGGVANERKVGVADERKVSVAGRNTGIMNSQGGGVGISHGIVRSRPTEELNMRARVGRGAGADRPAGMGRGGITKVVNDRICWENLDITQEREQQWRDERVTRNTRMMYDLSQQVKALQKQASKKKPQESTQPVIVQKLAAAQRAALRTLQGYGQSGHGLIPIPPELTLLIRQLGLLSTQLGGGVNTEMSDDLHQLMVKLDGDQVPKSEPIKPAVVGGEGLVNGKKCQLSKKDSGQVRDSQTDGGHRQPKRHAWTATKMKQYQGGMINTSLRHWRQDFTHFTDSTFNSARRQQPPLLYTPCQKCPPHIQRRAVNQSTPRFCHLHLSPADFKSVLQIKKARKAHPQSPKYVKSPLPVRSPKPARKKKKASHKKSKRKLDTDREKDCVTDLVNGVCSENKPLTDKPHNDGPVEDGLVEDGPVEDGSVEDGPDEDGPVITAAELNSAIASQANQLQELRREISQKLAELKSSREGVKTEGTDQLSSTDTTLPLEGYHDARVASMLRRLEQLEVEENTIRQRWNTISYEDPVITRPSVQEGASPQVMVTPQNLYPGASLPVLSSQSLSSIEQYRERYRNHLNLTTSQGQTSHPWKIAESVADDILKEALEGVANEMELLCDNCVEELYNYEFIRPP